MIALRFLVARAMKDKIKHLLLLLVMMVGFIGFCIKSEIPYYKMYLLLRCMGFLLIVDTMRSGLIAFSERELIHINNAPISRKMVLAYGLLKTHVMLIACFLSCVLGYFIRIVLSFDSNKIMLCLLTIALSVQIVIILSLACTFIGNRNRFLAYAVLILYFAELLFETIVFRILKSSLYSLYNTMIVLLVVVLFGLAMIIYACKNKIYCIFENSISYTRNRCFLLPGYTRYNKWNEKINFMLNKSILTESRERGGLIFDFRLLCISIFVIIVSIGLVQTVDRDGNALSGELVLRISMLLYVLCLGAMSGCKSIWQELSFSFLKLVPQKWFYKMGNILLVPFIRMIVYNVLMLIIINMITNVSIFQVLVVLIFSVSYSLVFLGIYIGIFRILGSQTKEENIMVVALQNLMNIIYVIPGIILIIQNLYTYTAMLYLTIINLAAFSLLFYAGKSICS